MSEKIDCLWAVALEISQLKIYRLTKMNEHQYEEAIEQSRKTATENLIEDALMELSSLTDNPWARMRLLAVIGLDDIEANTDTDSDDEDDSTDDLKERVRIIKNHLQNFIYCRVPPHKDPAYEDAMHHIENTDPANLPSYNALLPIHLEMCEEEERRQREEVEEIERAIAEAEAQSEAEKEKEASANTYATACPMFTPSPIVQPAPQQSEEDLKKQREEARLARLRFYEKK